MPSERRVAQLKDLGKIITGRTPPSQVDAAFGGEMPFITPTDYQGSKYIRQTRRLLSASGTSHLRSVIIPSNAIMVTCIGSDMGKVALSVRASCTNQQINSLIIETSDVPDYVYYNLSLRKAELRSKAGGSAQPILNKSAFGSLTITLPSREEQLAVAGLLSAIDDRIEAAEDARKTALTIAEELFKGWFVDFLPLRAKLGFMECSGFSEPLLDEYPDAFVDTDFGLVPSGWRITTLGEVIEDLSSGRRPKGGVGNITSGIPSIGAESIHGIAAFDYSKVKYVPEEFYDAMRSGKPSDFDILLYKDGGKPGQFMPRLAMFGRGFPFNRYCINEHVFAIRCSTQIGNPYAYFWMQQERVLDLLRALGNKAAIPGIKRGDVEGLPVVVPPPSLLRRFNEIAYPLIELALAKASTASKLVELRETLLPQLIDHGLPS